MYLLHALLLDKLLRTNARDETLHKLTSMEVTTESTTMAPIVTEATYQDTITTSATWLNATAATTEASVFQEPLDWTQIMLLVITTVVVFLLLVVLGKLYRKVMANRTGSERDPNTAYRQLDVNRLMRSILDATQEVAMSVHQLDARLQDVEALYKDHRARRSQGRRSMLQLASRPTDRNGLHNSAVNTLTNMSRLPRHMPPAPDDDSPERESLQY